MKKIFIFITLLIILTGCTKPLTINELYPLYNGEEIKLNILLNTVIATIGPYNNIRNELSSYNDSLANIYEYDTLEIETYFQNNDEKVYAINFTSEEQTTKEGLKIGDTKEKMLSLYGKNYENPLSNVFIYNIDNTNLSITLENDIILSIRYHLS